MSQMFLNVVSTFKGEGIQSANKQLGAFGKQTSVFGSILGKVGGALAAFGLAAKTVEFSKQAIVASRDLERNLFALDIIFADLAPKMVQFTKDAEEIGLSQSKAAKATTFIGSVLKQSGFEMDRVGVETQKLVRLGVDLAATYGYDVQEALLGMTALFRGEYDPIEKFGVAMKQAEINAVLAERGLNKLTGGALRNAEQTVRMELLYQRAADAIGVFDAQTGSLYTEQKKLGASFENMQAQVGTALLPAVVSLNTELRLLLEESTEPLVEIFTLLGQALEGTVKILRDAINPTTDLGESVAALIIQFESMLKTLFGQGFDIPKIFEYAGQAVGIFVDLMHDLLYIIEAVAIGFQVFMDTANGVYEGVEGFDFGGEIKRRIDIKDTMKANKLATQQYRREFEDLRNADGSSHREEIKFTEEAWKKVKKALKEYRALASSSVDTSSLKGILAASRPPGSAGADTGDADDTSGTGGGSSAAVRNTVTGIRAVEKAMRFEGKKATQQAALLGKGLSAGLVNQILTSSTPIIAANQTIKQTTTKAGKTAKKEVKRLNALFDGQISQVNQRASEAAAAANALADAARQAAAELAAAEKAKLEKLNELYANFLDTIKGTFAGIKDAIQGAFDITGLGGSTNAIIRNMNKLLSKLRSFSTNVKQLSTMGLDPALLQQVIQAGPMAGSRIASALVAGGAGALATINAGFGQVGSLASEIAETGVKSLFDTKAQQTQYNITVTGGVGSGATIGKAIVDAIKDYERTSGAVWQGA
jgi:hypothetical protein